MASKTSEQKYIANLLKKIEELEKELAIMEKEREDNISCIEKLTAQLKALQEKNPLYSKPLEDDSVTKELFRRTNKYGALKDAISPPTGPIYIKKE